MTGCDGIKEVVVSLYKPIIKRFRTGRLESLIPRRSISRISGEIKGSGGHLHSSQIKRTPQDSINEFIFSKLNPLLVVDFRLIFILLHA